MSDPPGSYPPSPPGPPPPPTYGAPPPPPYGAPPGWQPAPPPPPKHTGAIVLAIVGSVALFLVGIGIAGWAAFNRQDGPSHPDDWDPRVADIAQFVQTERGVLFEHPVHVDFLSDEEFTAEVTTAESELTDEDRETIDDSEAALRAMGLVEGDLDLFDEQNQLAGEGAAAFYDPETERITVRGTELTPEIRGTLAHEMTHALQDQYVDLDEVEGELRPDQSSLFRAVVEGDAVLVEDAYVLEELTAEEQGEYETGSAESAEQVDLEGVTPALIAFFQAPYVFGPSFVSVVRAEEGLAGVNDALRTPPESDRQLLDPRAYLKGTDPVEVEAPDVPEGAEVIEDGVFGALDWYVVLASRVDPKAALAVVDAWNGDSFVTYDAGGEVCVAARYEAVDAAGADAVRGLFDQWVGSMGGSASVTEVDDTTLAFVSCDPGADAVAGTSTTPDALLAVPAARLGIVADVLDQLDVPLDDAWCVAQGVIDAFAIEELTAAEVTPDAQQRVFAAMRSCGVTPG
jgi:hypothetical protein